VRLSGVHKTSLVHHRTTLPEAHVEGLGGLAHRIPCMMHRTTIFNEGVTLKFLAKNHMTMVWWCTGPRAPTSTRLQQLPQRATNTWRSSGGPV
jgi:hypothetical protein